MSQMETCGKSRTKTKDESHLFLYYWCIPTEIGARIRGTVKIGVACTTKAHHCNRLGEWLRNVHIADDQTCDNPKYVTGSIGAVMKSRKSKYISCLVGNLKIYGSGDTLSVSEWPSRPACGYPFRTRNVPPVIPATKARTLAIKGVEYANRLRSY
jgi:hypothetical protein